MTGPAANPLSGAWRTVAMDLWDVDHLDMIEPADIAFDGQIRFHLGDQSGFKTCRW